MSTWCLITALRHLSRVSLQQEHSHPLQKVPTPDKVIYQEDGSMGNLKCFHWQHGSLSPEFSLPLFALPLFALPLFSLPVFALPTLSLQQQHEHLYRHPKERCVRVSVSQMSAAIQIVIHSWHANLKSKFLIQGVQLFWGDCKKHLYYFLSLRALLVVFFCITFGVLIQCTWNSPCRWILPL